MSTSQTLKLTGDGAAYVRISKDQRDTQRQYEALHAFEKQHKVKIPEHLWFEDEGWARDAADDRPEFQRLMKLAEEGRVKWIVVSERDRFGTKSSKQLIAYLYRLEEAGCRLYDSTGKEWTCEDIATVITAVVDGEKSKGEQRSISERTLGGKVAGARAGEWQGGPTHLGFDVACYSRKTGEELWRVVFDHPLERLQVFPDGTQKRREPKEVVKGREKRLQAAFPSHQKLTEVLRITPSRDRAKVDAAVAVFRRFATESVSPTALANWLNNDLGLRTAFGGDFYGHTVRAMLEDPAYIGYYAWNKVHSGKFHRHKGGRSVLELNYEEKASHNDPADWVQSERLFEPLVDRPTWDAVRQKLAGPRRQNAPRSPLLYLDGLVFCANCGSKMYAGRGRSSKRGGLRFEFVCGGYQNSVRAGLRRKESTESRKESTESRKESTKRREESAKRGRVSTCLRNGVFQDELEPYVERWLKETGRKLKILAAPPDGEGRLLDRRENVAWGTFHEGVNRLCRYLMENHPAEYAALVEDHRAAAEAEREAAYAARDAEPVPPGWWAARLNGRHGVDLGPGGSPDDLTDAVVKCFGDNFDAAAADAEAERLDAEHTRLAHAFAGLKTPLAREKANQELADLEGRITELRALRDGAAERVSEQYRLVCDLQLAVADAAQALESDTGERAMRQKAQAVRAVIQRIECTFVATGETGGGHHRKGSRLVKVTIYPVVGDPAHYFLSPGLPEPDIALLATRATSPM
jgi:DNA invertase Pin-like site-specific DNA recombinase